MSQRNDQSKRTTATRLLGSVIAFAFCIVVAGLLTRPNLLPPLGKYGFDAEFDATLVRYESRRWRKSTTHWLVLTWENDSHKYVVPSDCYQYVRDLAPGTRLRVGTEYGLVSQITVGGQNLIDHDDVNNSRFWRWCGLCTIAVILVLPCAFIVMVDVAQIIGFVPLQFAKLIRNAN